MLHSWTFHLVSSCRTWELALVCSQVTLCCCSRLHVENHWFKNSCTTPSPLPSLKPCSVFPWPAGLDLSFLLHHVMLSKILHFLLHQNSLFIVWLPFYSLTLLSYNLILFISVFSLAFPVLLVHAYSSHTLFTHLSSWYSLKRYFKCHFPFQAFISQDTFLSLYSFSVHSPSTAVLYQSLFVFVSPKLWAPNKVLRLYGSLSQPSFFSLSYHNMKAYFNVPT